MERPQVSGVLFIFEPHRTVYTPQRPYTPYTHSAVPHSEDDDATDQTDATSEKFPSEDRLHDDDELLDDAEVIEAAEPTEANEEVRARDFAPLVDILCCFFACFVDACTRGSTIYLIAAVDTMLWGYI